MSLHHRIADALARLAGLHTLRCPHNCGVYFRYRHVSDVEAQRLAARAANHDGGHQHHT